MQDSTRDFSVYVLDPLEAPFIPPSADAQQQRGGVAVGLGLMSWALLADENESVGVNGTLIKQGQGLVQGGGQGGEQAVEVVFALREVGFYLCRESKANWHCRQCICKNRL
jgi:hypothetical protein